LKWPERTAALQQQRNALERESPFRDREACSKLEIHRLLSVWSGRTISMFVESDPCTLVLIGMTKRIVFLD
jgi:hypothetical protein